MPIQSLFRLIWFWKGSNIFKIEKNEKKGGLYMLPILEEKKIS